jgi:acyl-coenzyme A thioesterase PaaI-like protein
MNESTPVAFDRDRLRSRLLAALAEARAPGFHLPGYFLRMGWPRMGGRTFVQTMDAGPHCTDSNGVAHPAVSGILVDGALANSIRLFIEPGSRMATVHMDIQYTGHAARDALEAEGTFEGFTEGAGVRQGISRTVMTSGGKAVCYATGAFVVLPAPPGVALAPMPFERDETSTAPLKPKELDPKERGVMRAAERALTAADSAHAFIERFWDIMPRETPTGAVCRVRIAPQIGNRVGHVQGGILIGLAQATASAAVPQHPVVSNISAWYVSPGQGTALRVKSRVVHAGRSFAVVHTEVRNADRSLVLEAVSNHTAGPS